MIGIAEGVSRDENRSQFLLAFFQRKLAQIVAIDIEQIECVIEDGDIRVGSSTAAARTESRALLHKTGRGASLVVEGGDFAVEDCGLPLDRFWQILEIGLAAPP